jgi:hypothetical protein
MILRRHDRTRRLCIGSMTLLLGSSAQSGRRARASIALPSMLVFAHDGTQIVDTCFGLKAAVRSPLTDRAWCLLRGSRERCDPERAAASRP